MKRRSFLFRVGLLFLVGAGILTGSIYALGHFPDLLEKVSRKYMGSDEVQLKKTLEETATEELIEEINLLAQKLPVEGLIAHANVLHQRKKEIAGEKMLWMIRDKGNSQVLRDLMVDFYLEDHTQDLPGQKELKGMLSDPDISYGTKLRILNGAQFSLEEGEILKQFIEEDEGDLAFQGLRQLCLINPKEAVHLSYDILSPESKASDIKKSAALDILARSASVPSNQISPDVLVEQYRRILESSQTGKGVKESAFFALSDLRSKEAVFALLSSEGVDPILKPFAIEQNSQVLLEVMEGSPTEEELSLVIKAMEYLPLKDLYEPLEKAVDGVPEGELKKRGESVLRLIQEKGIHATNKHKIP